jgi:regulation of enolase protein 1 (concanavalin A-like superfamily)
MFQFDDAINDSYENPVGYFANNFAGYHLIVLDENQTDGLLEEYKTFKEEKTKEFSLVIKDNKTYDYLDSTVGDDLIVETNDPEVGVMILFVDENLLKVQISYKDVGFSEIVGNYAQDWCFRPINAYNHVIYALEHGKGSAITVSPDLVKLKDLSPVRKQSEMELDLASKYQSLYGSSDWVDENWLTYQMHQVSKLLGLVIFDFSMTFKSPFLTKSEGGCGGNPPWNNLDTLYSGLKLMQKGKSFGTTLGIMLEAKMINHHEMKPKESVFVKLAHIAETGYQSWFESIGMLETMKYFGYSADSINQLRSLEPLPGYLNDIGIKVPIEDISIGSAISHLRSQGVIMTELDVRLLIESLKKTQAITGNIPMREVLQEIETQKFITKKISLKFLRSITEVHPLITGTISSRYESLPKTLDEDFYQLTAEYYHIVNEYANFLSSFFYTEEINIFRTQDVLNLLGGSKNKILLQSLFENIFEIKIDYIEKVSQKTSTPSGVEFKLLREWIDSINESKSFDLVRPPGIGTDDSRMYQEARSLIFDHEEKNLHYLIIIFITNDNNFCKITERSLPRKNLDKNIILGQLRLEDYFIECAWIHDKSHDINRDGPKLLSIIDNKFYPITKAMDDSIRFLLKPYKYHVKNKFRVRFIYDVPNIDKSLAGYTLSSSGELRKFTYPIIRKDRVRRLKKLSYNVLAKSVKTFKNELDLQYYSVARNKSFVPLKKLKYNLNIKYIFDG